MVVEEAKAGRQIMQHGSKQWHRGITSIEMIQNRDQVLWKDLNAFTIKQDTWWWWTYETRLTGTDVFNLIQTVQIYPQDCATQRTKAINNNWPSGTAISSWKNWDKLLCCGSTLRTSASAYIPYVKAWYPYAVPIKDK